MSESKFNRAAGVFFLRCLAGLIFLMQGYGKVVNWGVDQVYENAFSSFETSWIPEMLLRLVAYLTSYGEMIGGLFLILGLFRKYALLTLAGILLLVSYGHGLQSPIWDLHHVVFRAVLILPLFFLPSEWDHWHMDKWLQGRNLI